MNSEHLRRALANGPVCRPRKPTSVPVVISLLELLTRAQNRLRPRNLCPTCDGTGQLVIFRCKNCDGTGRVPA